MLEAKEAKEAPEQPEAVEEQDVVEEEVTEEDILNAEEDESTEEVIVEDEVKETEEAEEEEEVLEEAKETTKPKMKNKTQKRIVGLVSKVKMLENQIESLQRSETSRSQQEKTSDFNTQLTEIQTKKREAMESGDYDKVGELDLDLIKLAQSDPKNIAPKKDFNAGTYFSENNQWYNNPNLDPYGKMTAFAEKKSRDLSEDNRYASWTSEQILDEVAKQTSAAFKSNPYKKKSPTDGVTTRQVSKREITVSKDELSLVQEMYPGLTRSEAIKEARALKKQQLTTT